MGVDPALAFVMYTGEGMVWNCVCANPGAPIGLKSCLCDGFE